MKKKLTLETQEIFPMNTKISDDDGEAMKRTIRYFPRFGPSGVSSTHLHVSFLLFPVLSK